MEVLHREAPLMDWKNHIVGDPEVLAGKPTIKGTRLSVDFILSLFAQGWTEQQVLENYRQLTQQDLQAAFAFVQACMAEEEYIALRKLA